MALILEVDGLQADIDDGKGTEQITTMGKGGSSLQCRACLSINRQLYLLNKNTELGEVFLKICSFYEEVPLNLYLCWECVFVLKKLVWLKNKVRCADSILRSKAYDEITLSSLCLSGVINTDSSVPICQNKDVLVETKPNSKTKEETVIKEERETLDNTIDDEMQCDDDVLDSQDKHVPEIILEDIKEKKEVSKKRTKYMKSKNVETKRMFENVDLTEEEIIEWMEVERSSEIFKKLEIKCDLCLSKLHNNVALETHMKLAHQKGTMCTLQCNICKMYMSEQYLSTHIKNHVGRVCMDCGYKCVTAYNMTRHIAEEHSEIFMCTICCFTCSSKEKFSRHYEKFHSILKCDNCKFKTRLKGALIKHMRRHYRTFICNVCNKEYRTLAAYRIHYNGKHVVDRTKETFCVPCGKQFDNVTALKQHLSTKPHKSQESVSCPDCGKMFSSKKHVNKHRNFFHFNKYDYSCVICNKNFSTRETLIRHEKSKHSDIPPQPMPRKRDKQCNFCGKVFVDSQTLTKHVRMHTGEKPYKCDHCPFSCSQKSNLKSHVLLTHTTEKPYKCDKCPASFARRSNLEVHDKSVHITEKPYKCDNCPTLFVKLTHLEIHNKRVHTRKAERPYKCGNCPASFARRSNLEVHNNRVHTAEKPYKCDNCPASFEQRTNLARHNKRVHTTKPYKCDNCPASFEQRTYLEVHNKRVHTTKPYKCDNCPASFVRRTHLEIHKKVHTTEKPYKCDNCPASFEQRMHLAVHNNRVHTSQANTIVIYNN